MAPAVTRGRTGTGRRTDPPGDLRMTEPDLEMVRYRPPRQESPVDMLAGLARLAAGAWWRSAVWGLGVSVRLARAGLDPVEARRLAAELEDGLRGFARDALGVAELDARVRQLAPTPPGRRS